MLQHKLILLLIIGVAVVVTTSHHNVQQLNRSFSSVIIWEASEYCAKECMILLGDRANSSETIMLYNMNELYFVPPLDPNIVDWNCYCKSTSPCTNSDIKLTQTNSYKLNGSRIGGFELFKVENNGSLLLESPDFASDPTNYFLTFVLDQEYTSFDSQMDCPTPILWTIESKKYLEIQSLREPNDNWPHHRNASKGDLLFIQNRCNSSSIIIKYVYAKHYDSNASLEADRFLLAISFIFATVMIIFLIIGIYERYKYVKNDKFDKKMKNVSV